MEYISYADGKCIILIDVFLGYTDGICIQKNHLQKACGFAVVAQLEVGA